TRPRRRTPSDTSRCRAHHGGPAERTPHDSARACPELLCLPRRHRRRRRPDRGPALRARRSHGPDELGVRDRELPRTHRTWRFARVRGPSDTRLPTRHRSGGWWGEDPPFHTPVVVLTHHEREPLTAGETTFHFLDASPTTALERALALADGQDVRIGGGVTTVREVLDADLSASRTWRSHRSSTGTDCGCGRRRRKSRAASTSRRSPRRAGSSTASSGDVEGQPNSSIISSAAYTASGASTLPGRPARALTPTPPALRASAAGPENGNIPRCDAAPPPRRM